jgi:trehalose 2-sulfotransferase
MHIDALAKEARCPERRASILDDLLPSARYIKFVRHDRRAQALSWYRAIATNEWCRIDGRVDGVHGNEPRDLNIDEVLFLEKHLAGQQSSWETFFRNRE